MSAGAGSARHGAGTTFLGMPVALPYATDRGTLRGDRTFPDAAREALTNEQLRRNLGHATRTIRGKRA